MANRYWVPGAVGAWNVNANWDAASGGPGPASFPVAGDNAFFDLASGAGAWATSGMACPPVAPPAAFGFRLRRPVQDQADRLDAFACYLLASHGRIVRFGRAREHMRIGMRGKP